MIICFSMNLGSTEQVSVKLKSHAAVESLKELKNMKGFFALEVSMLVSAFFSLSLSRVMLGSLWANSMEMTSAKLPSLALKP